MAGRDHRRGRTRRPHTLRLASPARRLCRAHSIRILEWRVATAGRHYQSRQRARPACLNRSRMGVPSSRESLAAYSDADRCAAEADSSDRLEGAGPLVQALSSPRRARQASERGRHRHRAGTDRVHVGDCEGGLDQDISVVHQVSGRRRRAAPVFRAALVDVKRRLRPILVPRSRQAR